ncbi:MAG: cupin [Bacteroidetes bacterium]|nr:MAG: cupin [Bacteroidota bacterium]
MQVSSFNEVVDFNDHRVKTSVILESSFSKEIRILFKKGQVMKEHKTPYPIIIHLIKGQIDFGVEGVIHTLKEGDILSLDGGIPHDLTAKDESIVRLTLSKLDQAERVEKVAASS